jgi:hypothetical protein
MNVASETTSMTDDRPQAKAEENAAFDRKFGKWAALLGGPLLLFFAARECVDLIQMRTGVKGDLSDFLFPLLTASIFLGILIAALIHYGWLKARGLDPWRFRLLSARERRIGIGIVLPLAILIPASALVAVLFNTNPFFRLAYHQYRLDHAGSDETRAQHFKAWDREFQAYLEAARNDKDNLIRYAREVPDWLPAWEANWQKAYGQSPAEFLKTVHQGAADQLKSRPGGEELFRAIESGELGPDVQKRISAAIRSGELSKSASARDVLEFARKTKPAEGATKSQ